MIIISIINLLLIIDSESQPGFLKGAYTVIIGIPIYIILIITVIVKVSKNKLRDNMDENDIIKSDSLENGDKKQFKKTTYEKLTNKEFILSIMPAIATRTILLLFDIFFMVFYGFYMSDSDLIEMAYPMILVIMVVTSLIIFKRVFKCNKRVKTFDKFKIIFLSLIVLFLPYTETWGYMIFVNLIFSLPTLIIMSEYRGLSEQKSAKIKCLMYGICSTYILLFIFSFILSYSDIFNYVAQNKKITNIEDYVYCVEPYVRDPYIYYIASENTKCYEGYLDSEYSLFSLDIETNEKKFLSTNVSSSALAITSYPPFLLVNHEHDLNEYLIINNSKKKLLDYDKNDPIFNSYYLKSLYNRYKYHDVSNYDEKILHQYNEFVLCTGYLDDALQETSTYIKNISNNKITILPYKLDGSKVFAEDNMVYILDKEYEEEEMKLLVIDMTEKKLTIKEVSPYSDEGSIKYISQPIGIYNNKLYFSANSDVLYELDLDSFEYRLLIENFDDDTICKEFHETHEYYRLRNASYENLKINDNKIFYIKYNCDINTIESEINSINLENEEVETIVKNEGLVFPLILKDNKLIYANYNYEDLTTIFKSVIIE